MPSTQILNSGGNTTAMAPEVGGATDIPDWTAPYVLSGARVGSRSVYRFTPRCLMNQVVYMYAYVLTIRVVVGRAFHYLLQILTQVSLSVVRLARTNCLLVR